MVTLSGYSYRRDGLDRAKLSRAMLVHGMGKSLVAPHWPPLTPVEAAGVMGHYPALGRPGQPVKLLWLSPRPTSAAALATNGQSTAFIKRHHPAVRSGEQLQAEHALAAHLRAGGQPVPEVLRTSGGLTTLEQGGWVYEVHARAEGFDTYRDSLSWSPFGGTGHARAAGQALARFHLASRSFAGPERRPGPLVNSCALITAASPLSALRALVGQRPALANALAGRPAEADFAQYVLPFCGRAGALLSRLPRWWGHGDWHSSNLTWNSEGPDASVAGVIDLGLANLTFAVHDLALAIERNCIDWLDLAGAGEPRADERALAALVEGYQDVRPISSDEAATLPLVLPICHVEHALSEVEYFAGIVGSEEDADLAYDSYLLGHLRWFAGATGEAMLARVAALAIG